MNVHACKSLMDLFNQSTESETVEKPEMSKGHDTPIMSKIKFSEPNPLIPKTTILPREPINNGSGCAFI